MLESKQFLSEQIITYLGNKRALLDEIGSVINDIKIETKKKKLITLDLFSGSGIVARYLKQFSLKVIANDLEAYSKIINECYLSNKEDFDEKKFDNLLNQINQSIKNRQIMGIITQNYAPKDDKKIRENERVFYTRENAILIDSYRYYIDKLVPEEMKKYFLASLLYEASVHNNTAGVFKGFYKDKNTGIGKFGGTAENALLRIKGTIKLPKPVLSRYKSKYEVFQEDANELVKSLPEVDVAYLDPPYNQHPYGSNYFMLNLILENKMPKETSKVVGIPKDWNRSAYNKRSLALSSLENIVKNVRARYVIVSYNNEGFISLDEMKNMLCKYGDVRYKTIEYNTYRGSRNLRNRSIHTCEYLFVLRRS